LGREPLPSSRFQENQPGNDWNVPPDDEETKQLKHALSESISVMFDDAMLQKAMWGVNDVSVAKTAWETGNASDSPCVLVMHGSDVDYASSLAKQYAAKGCRVMLPVQSKNLSAVADFVTKNDKYDQVDLVHGIGAGTIAATHLAAWRAVNGKPVSGLILDSPISRLQEIEGMKMAFGCVSQDPIQQVAKIKVAISRGPDQFQAVLVRGNDGVCTHEAFRSLRLQLRQHFPGAFIEVPESTDANGELNPALTEIIPSKSLQ